MVTRIPNQDRRIEEYQHSWVSGFKKTPVSDEYHIWIPGYQDASITGYQDTVKPEHFRFNEKGFVSRFGRDGTEVSKPTLRVLLNTRESV